MNKIYFWRKEKGVCIEHQNGFYELLTKPRMKATSPGLGKRSPWRWPLDLTCSVCPVPNTYIGMHSCIPTMIWWWCGGSATSYSSEVLGSTPKTWLNGLALSHVLRLTLSGTPKILLYCKEYRRPMTDSLSQESNCLANIRPSSLGDVYSLCHDGVEGCYSLIG